jgi:hypothetical protein
MMRKPVMSLQNHDQLPSRPREWIGLGDGGYGRWVRALFYSDVGFAM